MNIQLSEVMMSYPHKFSTHFIYRKWQKFHFQVCDSKCNLLSTQNKWDMMFILTYFNKGVCFYLYPPPPKKKKKKKKKKKSKIVKMSWQIVRVWHHHLTQLNIHKDWSRSVFRKYGKFQNVLTSLFLIRFSSFLCHFVGKFFLLFLKLL